MAAGQTPDSDQARYTLTEAAARLGISREALRLRIRRGRVLASKSGGQWYVYLPASAPDSRADSAPDTTADSDQGALVATLRDELEHARGEIGRLWSALEARDEELKRKDAIILALAQRPALPSPAGAGEADPTPGPSPRSREGPASPPTERSATDAAERRKEPPERHPWWRRLLGR